MMGTESRERRVGRARSALDDAARRLVLLGQAWEWRESPSEEEVRTWYTRPGASEKAQTK